MKSYLIILALALLQSCKDKPHTDGLISELSQDGKTMKIIRNGVQIATVRDSSDACFVELFGPDGISDANVSYYEEGSTGGAELKNIVLGWSQKGRPMKTVAYDSEGNIVKLSQDPSIK